MLQIDIARLRRDLERMAEFTATPGQGCTRFSYSPEDRRARDYLLAQLAELGLTVSTDGVGNIRARKEGRVPGLPPVLVGSHIDSVGHGGNFDGVLGVLAGLEVLRTIARHNQEHDHPLELIVFAEEEGSNFGRSLAGSKALVGALQVEDLKGFRDGQGRSMYQLAKDFGLEPDTMAEKTIKPGEVKALVELHIEQSVVLDRQGIPLGIVENVAGNKWLGVHLRGEANHAGATPMKFRRDPLAGAVEIMASVDDILTRFGSAAAVTTVGRIHCSPNIPNVIPGKVYFTLDVRDTNDEGLGAVAIALVDKVHAVARARGLEAEIEVLGDTKPVTFAPGVIGELERAARELGIPTLKMSSGALHDACVMTAVTDVGMLFVPSVGGRSHTPEEFTRYEDIEKGCNVLLRAILGLAQSS
ncbi:MAG: Zn-dependent hydrolase [Bacillota bacterium]|jgi:allantoate deiminase